MKKVPLHLLDILMPKVDIFGASYDEEILVFSNEEKAKKEKFLQEIQQQFEKQFHLSQNQEQVQGKENMKDDS